MNNYVFIATPISGFNSEKEYKAYREKVIKLIAFLREKGYKVHSELEKVKSKNCYDSPEKSVEDDFNNIINSDYFLLLHPARMQTSSLIELGYACALKKNIVAVGKMSDFPYLVIGYEKYSKNTVVVDIDTLSESCYQQILCSLQSVGNNIVNQE